MKQKLELKNQLLTKQNKVYKKNLKELVSLVIKIRRKCNRAGLWLSAGRDPYLPLVDESQQGPLVTQLVDLAQKIQQDLK